MKLFMSSFLVKRELFVRFTTSIGLKVTSSFSVLIVSTNCSMSGSLNTPTVLSSNPPNILKKLTEKLYLFSIEISGLFLCS